MSRHPLSRGRTALLALLPLTALATLTVSPSGPHVAPAEAGGQSGILKPRQPAARFGNKVLLRGRFAGSSRDLVQIQLKPKRRRGWRNIRRTRTGHGGAIRVRVLPRTTGRWRAVMAPDDVAASDLRRSHLRQGRKTNAALFKLRSFTHATVTRRHLRTGGATRVRGRVRPGGRRKVVIRGGGHAVGTRTRRNGRFSTRFPAGGDATRYRIRVRARANRRSTPSADRAGWVTAYRPASASYYGPGFYGNRTACGHRLTTSTQGVAHKTLPCGTKLRLRHRGRTVKVPVIDRGPYAAGRELDLTSATRSRLGFGSTGTVMMSR